MPTTASNDLRWYIAAWLAAGAAAASLATMWGVTTPRPSSGLVIALLVLTAACESLSLKLRTASGGVSLSLLEAAVTINVLLLPTGYAVGVVTAGVLATHLASRREWAKLCFNVGQHTVAAAAAATVVALAGGPGLDAGRALAVLFGLVAYSGVSISALAGLFTRLEAWGARSQLTDRPTFLAATTLGNASVGVIAVAVWSAYPPLTPIIVGPALALYLSYASSIRIERLLSNARSERDNLDQVVSGVQEGIVLLDPDGTVRLWNRAMERITGIAVEEAVGRPAAALLSGEDHDGLPVDPSYALEEGRETTTSVVVLPQAGGTTVETRITHTPITDAHGRLVNDVVLVRDLSREREASSLKEDFVARVSHELRTPLSPLRGYAQVLLHAGDRVTPDKREDMLRQMIERVDHLERLIEDLLLVSRLASGSLSPHDEVDLQVCDLSEIVPRLASWVESAHPGRDVRVVGLEGSHLVWADPLRCGQVLTNLLTNACRYATPGTPIDVIVVEDDGHHAIAVRDHGPGIPDDKLEAIFERFQRLEDPQRMRTGGLGLGLYIAKHLATAMGGALDVVSERGVGSTFTLRLPAPTTTQLASNETRAPARTLRAARPRALV